MLMFTVGVVVGGMHYISKVPPEGVVIGKTTYSARQLQTGLVCVAVPLFFFSSTIGTIFYIIGNYPVHIVLRIISHDLGFYAKTSFLAHSIIGASAVSILGHAAFMQEGVEGDFANNV